MTRLHAPRDLPTLVRNTFAAAVAKKEVNYYPTQVAILQANSIPVSIPTSYPGCHSKTGEILTTTRSNCASPHPLPTNRKAPHQTLTGNLLILSRIPLLL